MEKFYCPDCQKIFEAEGEKKEWQDKIYGPCWKKISFCPDCQKECEEHRVFKASSESKKENRDCSGNCSCCRGCF